MLNVIIILVSLCISFIPKTSSAQIKYQEYEFTKPTVNVTLPSTLHEISGTTIIDSATIACIQDEDGIIFLYDIQKYRIRKEIAFGLKADYEGICKIKNTIYVLISNGNLLEIEDYTAKKLKVKAYNTGIPAINNEGLCHDEKNHRLLIGEKGKINNKAKDAEHRFIYEFDLNTKLLNPNPLFNFTINTITQFAKKNYISIPFKKNKSGEITGYGFKFNTSEIAIHPITNQLYVLSAKDYCIFIFNMKGEIENIIPLNPSLFNKAESLSFFSNGDVLISNEGQAHQATLLRFNYKP